MIETDSRRSGGVGFILFSLMMVALFVGLGVWQFTPARLADGKS